jgi:chromosome segregation ATPase
MPHQAIESKPMPLKSEPLSEKVFVSPRVVDANAFDDYAISLRSLLTETDAHSQKLSSAVREALQLQQLIGNQVNLSNEHHSSLEATNSRGYKLVEQLQSMLDQWRQHEQDARDAENTLTLRICEAEQRRKGIIKAVDDELLKFESVKSAAPSSPPPSDKAPPQQDPALLDRLEAIETRLSAIEQSKPLPSTTSPTPVPMPTSVPTPTPVPSEKTPSKERAAIKDWKASLQKERERAQKQLDQARALRYVVTSARKQVASSILKAADAADRAEHAAQQNDQLLTAMHTATQKLSDLLKHSNTVQARLEQTIVQAGRKR